MIFNNKKHHDDSIELIPYKDMWDKLKNEIHEIKDYYDKGNDQLTVLECVDSVFICNKILKIMSDMENDTQK